MCTIIITVIIVVNILILILSANFFTEQTILVGDQPLAARLATDLRLPGNQL